MSAEVISQQLTLFVEDFPVKTSAELVRLDTWGEEVEIPDNLTWLEAAEVLVETAPDCGSSLFEWLTNCIQGGLLSKTFRIYGHPARGGTLPSSFKGWLSAGMASLGLSLTLAISEQPQNAEECSSSDVWMNQEVPERYYLDKTESAKYFRSQKPNEVHSRCLLDGTVELPLNDLDSVFLRKLTPVEQERAMGFPAEWTR